MGSYNAKEKIDPNKLLSMKENRKKAMASLKKRKNMELRKYKIDDSKTLIYKKFFFKEYNKSENNINEELEEESNIIIPREFINSFSFNLEKYYKFNKDKIIDIIEKNNKILKKNKSQIELNDLNNLSDYIDITELPLINPNKKIEKKVEQNLNFNTNKLINDNTYNNCINHNIQLSKEEQLRNNYYAKLIINDIWDPTKKEKRLNTIFFYDWDDTLLPTSYLTPQGQIPEEIKLSESDKDKLKSLDGIIYNILKKSLKLGDVYIVTNAAPGWVEYSCKKFYPKAFTLIDKISIKSARGKYERKIPGDSRIWKTMTFLDVLENININLITNLICFGDSIIEIEATHKLGEKLSNVYIKTIKFKEQPKPGELIHQLNTIAGEIDNIYSKVKNLSMRLEKKND